MLNMSADTLTTIVMIFVSLWVMAMAVALDLLDKKQDAQTDPADRPELRGPWA